MKISVLIKFYERKALCFDHYRIKLYFVSLHLFATLRTHYEYSEAFYSSILRLAVTRRSRIYLNCCNSPKIFTCVLYTWGAFCASLHRVLFRRLFLGLELQTQVSLSRSLINQPLATRRAGEVKASIARQTMRRHNKYV